MPKLLSENPFNELPPLPPQKINLDDPEILKKAIAANRYLAELKGYCQTLPNPDLLLNTIILQESKDSSAIEDIVTTQDDLYRAILNPLDRMPSATKEVLRYREAMKIGYNELKRRQVFNGNLAIKIMQKIKDTTLEFRKLEGTALRNPKTLKTIYTPPSPIHIIEKMKEWENYINEDGLDVDPLIIMALMHYQFEAIHPFNDGNGRTGRILNILFLLHKGLLTYPVLYHSSYIIQNKVNYYRRLRGVTERSEWKEWIIFILDAIKDTSISTLKQIEAIISLKEKYAIKIKEISQKLPDYELLNLIFSFPYIKIKILVENGIGKRQASSGYLQILEQKGILRSFKFGKEIYYVNHELMRILIG